VGSINVVMNKLAATKCGKFLKRARGFLTVSCSRRTLLYGLVRKVVRMRGVIDK